MSDCFLNWKLRRGKRLGLSPRESGERADWQERKRKNSRPVETRVCAITFKSNGTRSGETCFWSTLEDRENEQRIEEEKKVMKEIIIGQKKIN